MRKQICATLVMLFLAFSLTSPALTGENLSVEAINDSLIVVESQGIGITRNEALMDARRNAVQQATGVLSRGVIEVINDQVAENVVQLSRAFIENYQIEQEQQSGERWEVKITAWIRGQDLLSVLVQKDPDISPLHGAGLFVRALTRQQQIKEASEILIEIFDSIPYENYVRTNIEVGGINLRSQAEEITLRVLFSFERERYFSQAVPLFSTVLDYVAEAKLSDVPFMWELEGGNPVVITPPTSITSVPEYMELMEIQKANRYIDIPGTGNLANVYLLKKNYYFDCYHMSSEAFAVLMENLLLPDGRNRLTGRVFSGADLKIAFKNDTSHLINEHVESLNLHNVMVFSNLEGLRSSPYTKGADNQLNGQHHALFILPAMGTMRDENNYILIENDAASIIAQLPSGETQQISQADSSIQMRR